MWLPIFFFIVMIFFILFTIVTKLYKFKGTKLKTRLNYGLMLSLFFTLFFLWLTAGDIRIILKGFALGVILGIPFCWYYKIWLRKKVEGTTIFYKRRPYLRNLLILIPLFIIFQILLHTNWGQIIFDAKWPILGISLSFFFSQAYILFYVIYVEKKLGTSILEDQR